MEEPKNFAQTFPPTDNSPKTQSSSPAAAPRPGRIAPPPLEVRIRTLKSDLELLAQGGGFIAEEAGQKLFVSPQVAAQNKPKFFKWLVVVILIISLVGFGFFGYYVLYPLVFGENKSSSVQNRATADVQNKYKSTSEQQTNLSPQKENRDSVSWQEPADFIHKSFFQKDVDEVLTLVVKKGPALSANDLQTYNQRLFNLISSASSTSAFFEILIKLDTQPITAAQFSELVGSIVDTNFLSENFYPDFTAFVYKDENGLWPGYIFKLLPNKNWLFLKDHPAVVNIEKSNKLNLLFLSRPGNESSQGFEDEVILNQSFRALNYKNQGAKFIYGWATGGYFVLSTSRAGLEEALTRVY